MLCRNFWAAHEEAAEGDDPYLLLALDCSKGYNRMDHSWLQRCLRQASTPPEMLAIVESLLINLPVLILDGAEFAPLVLASGLTQGCPVSCMLYIVGVDPLLSSLQQTPHISGVSGFVDDWSMGCHGLPAISAVSISSTTLSRRGDNKSIVANLHSFPPDNYLMMKGPLVLQFGTLMSAFQLGNACLVCSLASMCPFTINATMQFTSLMWNGGETRSCRRCLWDRVGQQRTSHGHWRLTSTKSLNSRNERKWTPLRCIDRTVQMAKKKARILASTLPSHRSCNMRLCRPSMIGGRFAVSRIRL